MSRFLGSVLVLVTSAGIAMAQPGGYGPPPAPSPQPYAPQPYAPQPYAPQPYAYQPRPQVQLTAEEAEIWSRGPINDGAHIGGGVISLFFGFGIGQAVQGRYGDTGWIFTVGELGSGALMIYGLSELLEDCFAYETSCENNGGGTALAVGALAFTSFRIWEVVDAFAGPSAHNRRYKNIQMRVNGYAPPQWSLYLSPTMDKRASVAGLGLSF